MLHSLITWRWGFTLRKLVLVTVTGNQVGAEGRSSKLPPRPWESWLPQLSHLLFLPWKGRNHSWCAHTGTQATCTSATDRQADYRQVKRLLSLAQNAPWESQSTHASTSSVCQDKLSIVILPLTGSDTNLGYHPFNFYKMYRCYRYTISKYNSYARSIDYTLYNWNAIQRNVSVPIHKSKVGGRGLQRANPFDELESCANRGQAGWSITPLLWWMAFYWNHKIWLLPACLSPTTLNPHSLCPGFCLLSLWTKNALVMAGSLSSFRAISPKWH